MAAWPSGAAAVAGVDVGRIDAGLKTAFRQHAGVRDALPAATQAVADGQLPPSTAARRLLDMAGLGRPCVMTMALSPQDLHRIAQSRGWR